VESTGASGTANVILGGDAEPTTTTDQERKQREIEVPSWTATEFDYGGSHWLFVINSANAPASFRLSGWPGESQVTDAFSGEAMNIEADSPWEVQLPAYGVVSLRWAEVAASQPNP